MNVVIGWFLTLVFVNFAIFSITGYPLIWCWLHYAAKPLAYYVAIVNLAFAIGIIAGGIWYGPLGAVKMAVLMFGFNLVPSIVEAIMGFGYACR